MPDTFRTLPASSMLTDSPSRAALSKKWQMQLLACAQNHQWDRVRVLGSDTAGHTGCVNALSWAKEGELLLSGGDDTTVRLWRMDVSQSEEEYPFVCDATIKTGHRGNIFNAQLLPHSTRIATVARDGQIRIADIREGMNYDPHNHGRNTIYSAKQARVKVLNCHEDSVKRIVTEDSPDVFLTVSEDGTVRQHDLRVHHHCGSCPEPLVRVSHELSALAMSPLTPYQFVVAGESPYGYLFDRRQIGGRLRQQWGISPNTKDLTTCVRRFGRASRGPGERTGFEHITGARMASSNGHEVIFSYSSDATYLFSTLDDPQDMPPKESPATPPNKKPRLPPPYTEFRQPLGAGDIPGTSIENSVMEEDIAALLEDRELEDEDECREEDPSPDDEDGTPEKYFPRVPMVYPRMRYAGACNVETVKDVNFLGSRDDFVTSGSDDGHLFIWRKSDGALHDILEGDGHVVNVVEGHPHLPLLAVSGIDTTVKLFSPAHGPSLFSRIRDADRIVKRNADAASSRVDLAGLFMYTQLARRIGFNEERCTHQ